MTVPERSMIGTYELVRRLGVGGMGEVWLARQRGAAGFSREVAIKRLLPQAMEQRDVVQMFIEEAQITGRLRHPNVVNVVELGAAESGELYLVLEYVDGTGLHKLLRDSDSRPAMKSALVMARDVALALHAAHELKDDDGNDLGLVHRDVTPSNVMIDRYGHVKLMDFGIAKIRAKNNSTEAGIIKGKIAYLAPEQLKGSVDPRSDLFSLGLVLWESVAGQQARSASSDAVMMAKVALDAVPSIRTVMPDLPDPVAVVVDKACALDPDKRYQTGDEMAGAMLEALNALGAGGVEPARAELATAVKKAMVRDGGVVAGSTNASRSVDDQRPLALTLHSLVVQQDGVTLSRPLADISFKAVAPPDAQRTGTTTTGTVTRSRRGQKRSNALPVVAALASVVVVGAVVFQRFRARPDAHADDTSAQHGRTEAGVGAGLNALNAGTQGAGTTGVGAGLPTGATADAGAAVARLPATADAGAQLAANGQHGHPHNGTGAMRGGHGALVASNVDPSTPATLGIAVTPWGFVTIDHGTRQEAPVTGVSLPAGRHTIQVSNPDLQATRTISLQLAPGEHNVQRIDLRSGG